MFTRTGKKPASTTIVDLGADAVAERQHQHRHQRHVRHVAERDRGRHDELTPERERQEQHGQPDPDHVRQDEPDRRDLERRDQVDGDERAVVDQRLEDALGRGITKAGSPEK